MTEQEAQVLRDTATSAEQNALLNSQKLVKLQENYDLVCEILEQMIVGAANMLDIARDADRLAAENKALRDAVGVAYGHLWNVNNEPMAPILMYSPEKAAYAARKALMAVMTNEERGMAINAARAALKQEHITDDSPCWCCPEITYTDPDTGVSVIVHKEPQ
jgi:hypothetical protein